MPRALILGGTGLIGGAVARHLLAAGWDVSVTGRDPLRMPADLAGAGGLFVAADRDDPAALAAACGDGADLLVDCVCYTAAQARTLLPLAAHAGSTVMISSKAVYVDAAGNHSNSDAPPRFDGPVRETQPTMAPGDMPYDSREGYGPNKVAAEQVLLDSGHPVSVLRPSKVHGVGAARPREWVFVKRVLDRRPAVLLAHRGEGVDHTTAAANIAALVAVCAATPGRRVLNSADPDAPSARDIARTVARHFGHEWEEVPVDGAEPGATPWDAVPPIVLDTSAAAALGYRPVGDFATTVAPALDWVAAHPPADDGFFAPFFDYAAEDRWLAARRRDRDAVGRARNARPRDELGRPLPRGAEGVAQLPDDLAYPPEEALVEAQRLLDDGRAFSAHEVLEAAWKAAPDHERELWRGLAQLAVGRTHVQRGNPVGAVQLLRRGADRIAGYTGRAPYRIDVAGLAAWARGTADRIERDGLGAVAGDHPPRLVVEIG